MRKFVPFIIFYFISFQVFADFINLIQADKCETILEVFINEENVLVKLEIGEQDFQWLSDVIPKEHFNRGFISSTQQSRLGLFMTKKLILKADGKILLGKAKITEQRNRIARGGLYTGIADSVLMEKKIIYVEIEYPINHQIKELSITPPLQVGSLTTLANIGFIVYHKSIPVNDLRYLSNAEIVNLDWTDPWYSFFKNKSITRHHSSSFMSFLYVEPYEVRHEILVRIKDLEDWIKFDCCMEDMIQVNEQDSVKERIANFLINRNIIEIDGKQVKPIIDRIHFVEVQLSGIQIMEIPKPLPYASAIIGIIFAYPDEGMPKEVKLHWDMFNEKIQHIPTMSIDPAGPWPYDLVPSANILTWTNFLKHYKLPTVTEQKVEAANINVPLISVIFILMIIFVLFRNNWRLNGLSKWKKFFFVLYILLGILALPIGYKTAVPFMKKTSYSTPEAKDLIGHLLKNTYRAFDFREEGDIYDKLSMCNDNGLLQEIYLQTRKSMVIENQGGLEAKVDEVLITRVEEADPPAENGLAYRCNWIVKGVVGHWGHKHQRVNQYDAIISIKPVGNVWKMYDIDIIEEIRL